MMPQKLLCSFASFGCAGVLQAGFELRDGTKNDKSQLNAAWTNGPTTLKRQTSIVISESLKA